MIFADAALVSFKVDVTLCNCIDSGLVLLQTLGLWRCLVTAWMQ